MIPAARTRLSARRPAALVCGQREAPGAKLAGAIWKNTTCPYEHVTTGTPC
jgi:hypothetical protein